MQGRWGIRVACGLAALIACSTATETASAGEKVERTLNWNIQAQASNGYRFELQAFRAQPGGASVLLSFRNAGSSASYMLRRPERVTRRRIQADFGELGEIDIRYPGKFRGQRLRKDCARFKAGFGRFKGGLHIEGESGFSRVREGAFGGIVVNLNARKRCNGKPSEFPPYLLRGDRDTSQVLTSCGGASGAGFGAFEFEPGGESEFFATKSERAGDVQIIRTLSVSGATRRFAVSPDGREAKIRPPAPFEGRGEYRGGTLSGNLRAPLPGAGLVELTPGDASLGSFSDLRTLPECFPSLLLQGGQGDFNTVAVAEAFRQVALTRAARRAFDALGSLGD